MIDILKSIVKTILRKMGINRIPLIHKRDPIFIKNVFNSNSYKKALLSYIPTSFVDDNRNIKQHTNIYTSYLLGEILHELGYKVDVINWTKNFEGNYHEYDVVFGLGASLDDAFKVKLPSQKIIFFATGCNPFYCNQVTVKRVIDFHKRHGRYLIDSSRFVYNDWPFQHEAADWIIVHGESFATATYRNFNISSTKGPVFIKDIQNKKQYNWKHKSKHYLWFGSSGAIHKGLDLVLDAFQSLSDESIHLHICGAIFYETEFYEYYQPILTSRYVTYHGHVNIDSDTFDSIMETCGFVILPSASEGNSPSVITCMANGGLIPIVTESADVDITDFGIEIKALTVDAVIDAVKKSRGLSLEELEVQSNKIINYSKANHTFDIFKENIKTQLEDVLRQ